MIYMEFWLNYVILDMRHSKVFLYLFFAIDKLLKNFVFIWLQCEQLEKK